MKIAIIGAGTIGSVFAASLQRFGDEVTIIARPDTVPEGGSIRCTVEYKEKWPQWAIVPVVSEPKEEYDAAVLAVKTNDIEDFFESAQGKIRAKYFITTQAGPRGDILVSKYIDSQQIISCVPWFNAIPVEIGHVRINGEAKLYFGQKETSQFNLNEFTKHIGQSVPAEISPNINNLRWTRLLLTVPYALTAITNEPLPKLAQDNRIFHLLLAMMREAAKTLISANISLVSVADPDLRLLQKLHTLPGIFAGRTLRRVSFLQSASLPYQPTTLQSIMRGRRSEIDYLNGEIVRLGAEHGIKTPANELIVHLIHSIEETGSFISIEKLAKSTTKLS